MAITLVVFEPQNHDTDLIIVRLRNIYADIGCGAVYQMAEFLSSLHCRISLSSVSLLNFVTRFPYSFLQADAPGLKPSIRRLNFL